MYLETIPAAGALKRVAEFYDKDVRDFGFVMAVTECWTARSELLPTWEDFFEKVKKDFTLQKRDWRLIMFVAAKHAPSTYICHVYAGRLLRADLGTKEAVLAVFRDYRTAGLSDRDIAMLAYVEKVVSHARDITGDDIEQLRAVGFRDEQICDIALCAGLCCFLSRFFDAVGASPDARDIDPDERFQAELSVGKPLDPSLGR
jgi:uncharacterized peroxidase-related enzyme